MMCHMQGWSRSPGRKGRVGAGVGVLGFSGRQGKRGSAQGEEALQNTRSRRCTNIVGQVRAPALAAPSPLTYQVQTHSALPHHSQGLEP